MKKIYEYLRAEATIVDNEIAKVNSKIISIMNKGNIYNLSKLTKLDEKRTILQA